MTFTLSQAFGRAFMGQAPQWYKLTVIAFLIANPILLLLFGPLVTGWAVLAEFIFTLALALRCYPLQPGGLLALEAVVIGLTTRRKRLPGSGAGVPGHPAADIHGRGHLFPARPAAVRVHAADPARALARDTRGAVLRRLGAAVGVSRCAHGRGGRGDGRPQFLRGVSPRRLGQDAHGAAARNRNRRTRPGVPSRTPRSVPRFPALADDARRRRHRDRRRDDNRSASRRTC